MANTRQFERTLDLAVKDLQSPAIQKWHAQVARQLLAEEMAAKSTTPKVITLVDGREGAAEESVKFPGTIRYEFVQTSQAIEAVVNWLLAEGAKVGPKYVAGFFVAVLKSETQKKTGRGGGRSFQTYAAEGRMIPAKTFSASSAPDDAEFIIGNAEPYNRLVDIQLAGSDPVAFRLDDMIWDRAALWTQNRYPELAARRAWNLLFDGHPTSAEGRWILKRGKNAGKQVQSPGLVVRRA